MKAIKYGEITVNGGEQWRPIIAVKDIAGYVTEACHIKCSGTYVISSENVTMKDLGERVVEMIPNTKINYTEMAFQDTRNYRVDNQKSLSTFEYSPKVTVEEEVERMMNMFRQGRIKDPEDLVYHNGNYLKANLNPRITL